MEELCDLVIGAWECCAQESKLAAEVVEQRLVFDGMMIDHSYDLDEETNKMCARFGFRGSSFAFMRGQWGTLYELQKPFD